MMSREKVFIHSPDLSESGYPQPCPFNTRRAGKTLETLTAHGLMEGADRRVVPPEPLDIQALQRFHTLDYLEALRRVSTGELSPRVALDYGLGTPETPLFEGLFEFTRLAAGGTRTAARLLLDNQARVAFNPSGGFHHAHPGRASGFCYLNDLVMGVNAWTDCSKKVAFLDIDAHHCDGVQDAFYRRADVLTISLHESGRTLFPGTGYETEIGEGEGRGFTANLPLPVGTYDGIYTWAFNEAVMPLLQGYDPDLIVLEAGMDALAGDPLAHLRLTNNTHADIVARLLRLDKPLLVTGGGGYHFDHTVRGWALCWSVLCGDQESHDAMMLGMGGVMIGTTEWSGGLRDGTLLSDAGRREGIDAEVKRVVQAIHKQVFPLHGL